MKRYLILGSGVAGRRAAKAIHRKSVDSEITIVEEQENPFYARPMLGDFFGRKTGAVQSTVKEKERLSELGIKFKTAAKVKEIRLREQSVLLNTSEVLFFDKMLIASGTKTARLACDQGNAAGVVYMDKLEDIQALGSKIDSVKRAVVFGSSYQAFGALKGLRSLGIDCTLVIPEERLWGQSLDAVASNILEQRLSQEKITVVKRSNIEFLEQDGDTLRSVIATGGNKISADLLVVAAPQEPVLDYLVSGGLNTDRGIIVDAGLKTNTQNIFAAGDVAQLSTESMVAASLQSGWLRAWKQGNIAGENMVSGDVNVTYDGVPSIRTRVFDLDLVCLGLSGAEGEGIEAQSGDYPYEEMPYVYKKIIYKQGKVAGAIFLGDVNEAGAVEEWIRKGIPARECDKQVLDNMFELQYKSTAAYGVLCPVCKFHMQIDDKAEEGSIITCPACGIDFKVERLSNGAFHAVPV